ncbi:MAG: dimethylarginine dimethylaminohydrolase family protein [Candidatus Acetothermia bacterium]
MEERYITHLTGDTSFKQKVDLDETKHELSATWGSHFGHRNEVGKLKSVLLKKPGKEIAGEVMENPGKWHWRESMDPDLAREQHASLVQAYRDHGVEVNFVEHEDQNLACAIFVTDSLFMTPEGAILANFGLDTRKGEEIYVRRALAKMDVPVVGMVHGAGKFEGATAMWVDPETVIIGTSIRTNETGKNQVKEILSHMGVKTFLEQQIPYRSIHIDGIMSFVDRKKVLVDPDKLPYEIWKELTLRGFEMLEQEWPEERNNLAINTVALEPGRVLMAANNPRTKTLLEENGVETIEVDISEIIKGGGGIHCMTGLIKREPLD